jgi:chromate transporter
MQPNRLVTLVNVFATLSILAVGGGTAVLPQMKHDVVSVHRWLTSDQFNNIYSLGQLAPGPNMSMVSVIGYHAAGVPGAILTLIAFFLPSCMLTYSVSHIWDHFAGSPWRAAVQRGMAPITIGLMMSGVYALRAAVVNPAREASHNAITFAIAIAVTATLLVRHVNPALLILIGGAIGYFTLR